MTWPGSLCQNLGLDLCGVLGQQLKPPTLSAQMVAALELVTKNHANQETRQAYDNLKIRSRHQIWQDMATDAWALEASENNGGDIERTLQHKIRFKIVNQDVAETDPHDLFKTAIEKTPWRLRAGTRDSLARGLTRNYMHYEALRKKPRGNFAGKSRTLYALSDFTETLPDRKCYIIENDRIVLGEFVVSKYPIMLPTDLEIWEAVQPPPGWAYWPKNAIICSRRGFGLCALSGGDYDGDTAVIIADPDVHFLVHHGFPESYQKQALFYSMQFKSHMKGLRVAEDVLGCNAAEYQQFVSVTSVCELRGFCCTRYEKAQQRFLNSATPWSDATLEALLVMAEVAYAAYDAPKKFHASTIVEVCMQ